MKKAKVEDTNPMPAFSGKERDDILGMYMNTPFITIAPLPWKKTDVIEFSPDPEMTMKMLEKK